MGVDLSVPTSAGVVTAGGLVDVQESPSCASLDSGPDGLATDSGPVDVTAGISGEGISAVAAAAPVDGGTTFS